MSVENVYRQGNIQNPKKVGLFDLSSIEENINFSFLIYLLMVLTGFNLIMGLVGSVQMLRKYFTTRNITNKIVSKVGILRDKIIVLII